MSTPLYLPAEAHSPNPGAIERSAGALNGATAVTVVPAPGQGRVRQVFVVTVPNNTAGALIINLFHNDGLGGGTSVNLIDHLGVLAAAATYSSAGRLPIIVLRDYDSLEMTTTVAATPKFYACWSEGPASVFGSQIT